MRWARAALIGIAIVASGCASGTTSTPGASTPIAISGSPAPSTPTPAASPSPAAIVGEWVGVHDCQRIVTMLRAAGQEEFLPDAIYGNGLLPGDPQASALTNPKHPCDGAVQRKHSHFFTASGEFGSKDYSGERVDKDTYTLEGADVIVINDQRFHYRISGDQLSLDPEPVDISGCSTRECRFMATWVLMVAMPGMAWTRGEITSS